MESMKFIEPAIIITVITALVQVIKQIPIVLNNKLWSPTISVLFGVALGVIAGVFYSGETELPLMVFQGLIYGLSACGLYSFGNQFLKK